GLYVALGLLDLIRGRILVRIGISLDETLSERVYQTIVRLPSIVGLRNDGSGPMRDLDSVRSFLGGLGPVALFDLPWIPVYLGIYQQASAGIIIAGSILSARALAPVDIAIAHWRGWVAARQSWDRLRTLLATLPPDVEPMALQPPQRTVMVDNASVAPPGVQ